MGDGLKLTKDKRHRSSSSLTGVVLDGTRSERKLEINASIPEVDDQFIVAEARCDDLQEKIDFIKSLKRKKKLRKRSMTKMSDQSQMPPEQVPFITVRTQPKKKVSPQAARLHRIEVPPNPTRGYLDPATVEQHRMIGQVRGYNNAFKQPNGAAQLVQERNKSKINCKHPKSADLDKPYSKNQAVRKQRAQADGDSEYDPDVQISNAKPVEVACGDDEVCNGYYNDPGYDEYDPITVDIKPESRHQRKVSSGRRKHVLNETSNKEDEAVNEPWRQTLPLPLPRRRTPFNRLYQNTAAMNQPEERPVLELFNKDYATLQPQNADMRKNVRKSKKARSSNRVGEQLKQSPNATNIELKPSKKEIQHPRRIKYRSRRYEMPTVASQMKQAGMRYYYDSTNHTNIPFVVSKSTAPSHNIGVNIQQVLNGLKIQQPLSGIPATIAHHMGLGHMPSYGTKSAAAVPALDNREINVIKVGRRLLRLPSYKYVSYNRLLSLYSEGDGMVPRFLRAMSRPHYFYTSMYNLATNHDDLDGATSKGRATSQEAKQNLTEFAKLYREYENLNKRIKEGNCDPELEQRLEQLTRELAAREQNIHKVVQDYRNSLDNEQPLRASASTAEDGYRHSSYKIGDTQ